MFGDTTQQKIYHATFRPTEPCLLTGGENGKITWWEDSKAAGEMAAHALDCRCLKMRGASGPLLSAGGDGRVISWDMSGTGADFKLEMTGDGNNPLTLGDPEVISPL